MFGEHKKFLFQNENNVVLNENSVGGKPCKIDKVKSLISQFSYTVVTMNMKLLTVVTPLSIYQLGSRHGCLKVVNLSPLKISDMSLPWITPLLCHCRDKGSRGDDSTISRGDHGGSITLI